MGDISNGDDDDISLTVTKLVVLITVGVVDAA